MYQGFSAELGVLTQCDKQIGRTRGKTIDALDPRDEGTWQIAISDEKLSYIRSKGIHKLRELAKNVVPGLLNPISVYRGIRTSDINDEFNDDTDDWLCYVSRPEQRFISPTVETSWPKDRLLLTYITDARDCYLWYPVKTDNNNPSIPEDLESRFKNQVWPSPNGDVL